MSAKPATIGHWTLITKAAADNDRVELFVSTSDRERPGEVPISGADMQVVWKRYLQPHLPSNVKLVLGGVPVRLTWEALDRLSKDKRVTKIRIYGGRDDLAARFTEKNLAKYASEMHAAGKIELVPLNITAGGTDRVSGTQMRQLLAAGEREQFERLLPPIPAKDKRAIWTLLSSHIDGPQTEALVRQMISSALFSG